MIGRLVGRDVDKENSVMLPNVNVFLSSEIDRHLLEFQGGTFPLAAIGSCKGSGGRKGRDSGMWRRANTSPRKKGSPTSNWTCGGSLREGQDEEVFPPLRFLLE